MCKQAAGLEGKNGEGMDWDSSRPHGLTPDRMLLMMIEMIMMMIVSMAITLTVCAVHFQPVTILFVCMTTYNAWQCCTYLLRQHSNNPLL
jgi:hypothetical protein